jgi:hypothetical protein
MTLSRRDRLILLVRWYPEARSQGERGQGSGGTDDRILLPGELWWNAAGETHRVWLELERCLQEMSERRCPKAVQHLKARYWQVQTRKRPIKRTSNFKGKRRTIELVKDGETQYELYEFWPKWVDQYKVSGALDILERIFEGDPSLPKPLLEAVAA